MLVFVVEGDRSFLTVFPINQDLRITTISCRGEWHSPATDSVLPNNLRNSCHKY
ncbi:MAG: hypothetical protein F6K08_23400 [Okeania sp. SIO1H6]|nr:hypothetical protein [Okeania sp. SIO1H6]